MDCSVIICTYNRATSLEATLEAVLRQDFQRRAVEIIVVDNGSTDDTRRMVEKVGEQADGVVRYIFEPQIGLSKARNTGVAAAIGVIVLFIDDDALPRENWLNSICQAYCDDVSVACAGGEALPIWPNGLPPEWLHERLWGYLGLVRYGFLENKVLNNQPFPFGVNISFRKEIVTDFGGFSTKLGRKGGLLLSGEEIDLCLKIVDKVGRVVYVEGAKVDHVIDSERISKDWFMKRAQAQGETKAVIEFAETNTILLIVKRLVILIGSIVGFVGCTIIRNIGLAFYFKCKKKMSLAYLNKIMR